MRIEFLSNSSYAPSDIATSSARTCYTSKGIVSPKESRNWNRKEQLLIDLFKSGHHTTLQHSYITMMISGISRHLIWRLLHSHSFYNSEQVSQRYAKMSIEYTYIPKGGDSKEWKEFYNRKFSQYLQLIKLLNEPIAKLLPKFRKRDSVKKAQEIARYVLPQGTTAYLYHTTNILTILRYIAVAPSIPEAREEAKEFADILANGLIQLDPSLKPLVEFAKSEAVEFPDIDISKYRDRGIVFDVVGGLDFEMGNNYGGVMRNSQMVFDEGIIGGFSSYLKLSLSADAQNQRHRRTLSIRPALEKIFSEEFYIPPIFEDVPKAKEIYISSIEDSYHFFNQQRKKIGFSEAVYSLPNSHLIEIVERNDWSSFHHKAQMRLCFNAQEEIYHLIYKQVQTLRKMKIRGAEKLLPPCGVRKKLGIFPICPEGVRFCGVKVWKIPFSEYRREI